MGGPNDFSCTQFLTKYKYLCNMKAINSIFLLGIEFHGQTHNNLYIFQKDPTLKCYIF